MIDEWVSFTDDLDKPPPSASPIALWKILVVDDDFEIHSVTEFVLRDRRIFGRPLQLLHAYNSQQAREQLRQHPGIAVALLDVVMETEQAGLDLIHYIRDELGMMECQIILRTGQPSYAPELSVIDQYDINDYRTKAELTHTRLISTISTALRCYQQLYNLAQQRQHSPNIPEPVPPPYQWLNTPVTRLKAPGDTNANVKYPMPSSPHIQNILSTLGIQERAALSSLQEAVITTDTNALVNYLNPSAEKLTGWMQAEAQDRPLNEILQLVKKKTREPDVNLVARCLAEGQIVQLAGHIVLIDRHDQEHDVENSIAPIRGQDSEVVGVVLMIRDINANRRLARQHADDANYDPITGLINRLEFERRLERALHSTRQYGFHHALCLLNLNRSALVNATDGTAAGDSFLKQIHTMLSGIFRERDTLARIGHDEFGLLLENCPLDCAQIVANNVAARIQDRPFRWQGQNYHVGVHIGLIPITAELNPTQLMTKAQATYNSTR